MEQQKFSTNKMRRVECVPFDSSQNLSSGKDYSISFPTETNAYFLKEHGISVKKQHSTAILRSFRKNEKREIPLNFCISALYCHWKDPFHLVSHQKTQFFHTNGKRPYFDLSLLSPSLTFATRSHWKSWPYWSGTYRAT